MTPTLRATSPQSVSTSYGCLDPLPYVAALTEAQKIRTIELDGKTVKLQIVCLPRIARLTDTDMARSGTQLDKSASEQSLPPTTVAPTVSASSTMLPTWIRSTT